MTDFKTESLYLGPRRDAVVKVDAEIEELSYRQNDLLDRGYFSKVTELQEQITAKREQRARLFTCHILDIDLIERLDD